MTDVTSVPAGTAHSAEEAQRARLVREFHDGIAQRLAALGFHLSAAERALSQLTEASAPVGEARTQIGLARALCELAAAETRAAISGLRPPVLDDLGLSAALATLAREATSRQPSLDVTVAIAGEPADALPSDTQTALYRIAQEAVGNCLRHAGASCLDLVLERDGNRVVLLICDDGRGFTIPEAHSPDRHGLRSMTERAALLGGRVTITSRPGSGTTVEVTVPLLS